MNIQTTSNLTVPPLRDIAGPSAIIPVLEGISGQCGATFHASSREHPSQIRQAIDTLPFQMFILEPDFSDCHENHSSAAYFGRLESRSPGERIVEFTHPDDVDQILEGYHNALSSDIPLGRTCRLRSSDGTYQWFFVALYPLRDEQGHVVRWCGVRIDVNDQMQLLESGSWQHSALREEVDRSSVFEGIVGTAPALKAALSRVVKVGPTDSTVLITGETGTGKELVARAIHKRSSRASRPFISVNCAAIPQELIASELFGHEKGAFTGALQRRIGRFEQAEGGTIFLDEIGELPAETQVALLRVLQEREIQRIGSALTLPVNARVIAATHRDLPAAIEAGMFRSDLFYRINVFPIEMPALRERKEDIPLLVQHFVDRYAGKMGKKIRRIRRRSMDRLKAYGWPGNIRELQNVIERSMILCGSEDFSLDESWIFHEHRIHRPLADELVTQEKHMIETALVETRGRVSGSCGAAVRLGMPASTLDSKIRAMKIDKRRYQVIN